VDTENNVHFLHLQFFLHFFGWLIQQDFQQKSGYIEALQSQFTIQPDTSDEVYNIFRS